MKRLLLLLITFASLSFATIHLSTYQYIQYMQRYGPWYQRMIVQNAFRLLGIPYKFGGNTIYGVDCSAFVMDVYRSVGIDLPRTAREQAQFGFYVPPYQWQPGDLLFFQTYAPYPSHVAIYLGNGWIIDASSQYHKVTIENLFKNKYLMKHYLFARRLV
jgi:cell wall-associated NlpC family hydrolase